jgi:hypothetical protein
MKKVFIGGSRNISKLNNKAIKAIDQLIERELMILIGDANGADKAVQSYLVNRKYQNVIVFCMQKNGCRNNLGNWETRFVKTSDNNRNFQFYSIKDSEMASESDCGFMLWDAKSKGTLNNILNLLKEQKPIFVYFSPSKSLFKISNREDLAKLLIKCDHNALDKLKGDLKFSEWLVQPSLWGQV